MKADFSPRLKGFLRTILPLAIVAGLAQMARARDVFGEFTRPVVLTVLKLLGFTVSDQGDMMRVGHLEIPWSSDCAGMNLLLILLALGVWMNRSEKVNLRYWMKLLAMIPAAVVANVARVLTIIAYRQTFYPAIESQQLHYFFGLVWLVPFAILIVPRGQRPWMHLVVELLHAAAVVALLAPIAGASGALALTLSVVLCLAHCKAPELISPRRAAALILWILAAIAIGLAEVESLWMPWLLVCPIVAISAWFLSPAGLVLLASSYPLFHLIPGGELVTWIAIAYAAWREIEKPPVVSNVAPETVRPRVSWRQQGAFVLAVPFFVMPFLGSILFAGDTHKLFPPADVTSTQIPGDGFEITLPGQSPEFGLLWYGSQGSGRHHTLEVCMKYRGIDLVPVPDHPDLMSDDDYWFREFFLQKDRLIPTYLDYLKATIWPRSSPGVHLILVAKKSTTTPEEFNRVATELSEDLYERTAKEVKSQSP